MALVLVLFLHGSVWGYDLADKFSIGGIIAGAYQHRWLDDDKDGEADDNIGRGAVNFEPEFSFRPDDNNEVFAKFGYGAGNGLNGVTVFRLAPWAANLQYGLPFKSRSEKMPPCIYQKVYSPAPY